VSDALEISREAKNLAEKLGDIRQLSACLNHIANCYIDLCWWDDAYPLLDESEHMFKEISRPYYLVLTLLKKAQLKMLLEKDYRAAIDIGKKALKLAGRYKISEALPVVHQEIGDIGIWAGKYKHAISSFDSALKVEETAIFLTVKVTILISKGWAFAELDDVKQVKDIIETVEQINPDVQWLKIHASLLSLKWWLAQRQGERDLAQIYMRSSLHIIHDEIGNYFLLASTLLRLLRNLVRICKWDEALLVWHALNIFPGKFAMISDELKILLQQINRNIPEKQFNQIAEHAGSSFVEAFLYLMENLFPEN